MSTSLLFRWKAPARGSLKLRRAAYTVRRLVAALCAGLAVFFGLQSVIGATATYPTLVASQLIRRGTIIAADQVRVVQSTTAGRGLKNPEDAIGRIAQIPIEAGERITTHMARDAPIAAPGQAVIDVQLATASATLIPGDRISLVSAVGCERDNATCVLADDAVVITTQTTQTPASCAMAPDDALAVLQAQETGTIIAVMH